MADRGLALLDADSLLMVIEERGELRVAASAGTAVPRLRITPVQGSALGALYQAGTPLAVDRPRGQDAAWLHELGLEARAALVEPFSMEGQGSGLVIALRSGGGFRDPDRQALSAFAASVAQRLAAERSVEIERLRYGMEARERERTRWAREIHDESIQGIGALRLRLANARDINDGESLREAVDTVLEGLGTEIDQLRHLITELRPAALDDLGLAAALEALARRAQAIDGLEVKTEIARVGQLHAQRAHALGALVVDLARPAGPLALACLHPVTQALYLHRADFVQLPADARDEGAEFIALLAAEVAVAAQRDHEAAPLGLQAERLHQGGPRLEPQFVQPRRFLASGPAEGERLAGAVERAQGALLHPGGAQAHLLVPAAGEAQLVLVLDGDQHRSRFQEPEPPIGHQAQQRELGSGKHRDPIM